MRTIAIACLAAGLVLPMPARSASFCVDTVAEIRNSMLVAESNGQDDEIRIEAGVYTATGNVPLFEYIAVEDKALTLRGGYLEVEGFGCATLTRDPRQTTFDGNLTRKSLRITANEGSSANLRIENLSIRSGSADRGAGIEILAESGYTGAITIDRVHMLGNRAGYGGALYVETPGVFTLRNSLLRNNSTIGDVAAAVIAVDHVDAQTPRVFVGGNTVVRNACAPTAPPSCSIAGLSLVGSARAVVFNNAFDLNEGLDLAFDAAVELRHNAFDDVVGDPDVAIGNLFDAEIQFVEPEFSADYRIRYTSPLREAGIDDYDLGSFDANGAPRRNDVHYDIGAFENAETIFGDGFEATP